ncbi:MAG: hypothetical protein WCX27_01400 [Candidatus Paceibacterota bacterium]|jgi:hypothetical protein
MNEETKKIIAEQMEAIPKELKDAIFSPDYPIRLQEIVKNNKLMIDQAGNLETETTLVMLGLEPLEDYIDNLINNVGLSRNLAFVVAHDVNETIFKNIRESLKKISEQRKEADTQEKAVSQPEVVLSAPQVAETIQTIKPTENIETKPNLLPEVEDATAASSVEFLKKLSEKNDMLHQNVAPVENIVGSKTNETIVLPKENIVIEEKSKLPPAPQKQSGDLYREPIN